MFWFLGALLWVLQRVVNRRVVAQGALAAPEERILKGVMVELAAMAVREAAPAWALEEAVVERRVVVAEVHNVRLLQVIPATPVDARAVG